MTPYQQNLAPQTFRFEDDGETPNNPKLPLVLYPGALDVKATPDPAAAFEAAFAAHGWGDGWRNGIYDFLHVHTRTQGDRGVRCQARRSCRPARAIGASPAAPICWWSAPTRPTTASTSIGRPR